MTIADMNLKMAFLRDICEHPEDDTPRLIYADFLEESGIDPVRGEYIKLSVEHYHYWSHSEILPKKVGVWLKKEKLLLENEDRWREECFGLTGRTWHDPDDEEWSIRLMWQRGFVHAIWLKMDDFLFEGCAKSIFSYHPVQVVNITDKAPQPRPDGRYGWNLIGGTTRRVVPDKVFRLLEENGSMSSILMTKVYDTEGNAMKALSDALVLFGMEASSEEARK